MQQDFQALTWSLPAPLPGLIDGDGAALPVITPCQQRPNDYDAGAPMLVRQRAAAACRCCCPALIECGKLLVRLEPAMGRGAVLAGTILDKRTRNTVADDGKTN